MWKPFCPLKRRMRFGSWVLFCRHTFVTYNVLLHKQHCDFVWQKSLALILSFCVLRLLGLKGPSRWQPYSPSIHVSVPSTETGRRKSESETWIPSEAFSQCQLANIIDSRVVLLFTTLPSLLSGVCACTDLFHLAC